MAGFFFLFFFFLIARYWATSLFQAVRPGGKASNVIVCGNVSSELFGFIARTD